MPQEFQLSYRKVTHSVRQHFATDKEMKVFFAKIYPHTNATQAHPSSRQEQKRRRRIKDCPAVVLLGDYLIFRNFIGRLAEAERDPNGDHNFSITIKEFRETREAYQTLVTLVQIHPGRKILQSIDRLLPLTGTLTREERIEQFLEVLESDVFPNILRDYEPYLNPYQNN